MQNWSRRDVLGVGAAVLAGGAGGSSRTDPTIRVDTHLHCFAGRDSQRFPYHVNAPYRPERAATPEHLLSCMDSAGVAAAVVVHPEPYQDDHRYLEHCLTVGGDRLRGTCLFFADDPRAIDHMWHLAARLAIGAARIHAYAPGRLPPFGKPELSSFWRAVGEAGLAIQLHFEPRYAPGFEPLIREFPETPVIIDHLGRPFQGTPEEHAVVARWSRFPNTIMKLSSIPSTRNYPHRDPAPVVRRLCDAWGPDRMICGGGFGADATGASYRAAFDRTQAFLSNWSDSEQSRVLGGNALRLFGFPDSVASAIRTNPR